MTKNVDRQAPLSGAFGRLREERRPRSRSLIPAAARGVTKGSVDRMKLAAGDQVTVIVKGTAVMIGEVTPGHGTVVVRAARSRAAAIA
jgi:hypothetical protein